MMFKEYGTEKNGTILLLGGLSLGAQIVLEILSRKMPCGKRVSLRT
jgi:hypothetical protein